MHFMTYFSKVIDDVKLIDDINLKIARPKPQIFMLSSDMQLTAYALFSFL